MPTIEIHGQCAAGFEPVKEAFAELFESSGEAGSSCAVYVKGELTVNLWAGRANQEGNAWQQDTLVNVFSVSKAVTALCVHKAVELGIDGVELDVFLTADDKVVVFHDEDTERLTGQKGDITKMTWDEISKLHIQSKIDSLKGGAR